MALKRKYFRLRRIPRVHISLGTSLAKARLKQSARVQSSSCVNILSNWAEVKLKAARRSAATRKACLPRSVLIVMP